MFPIHGKKKAVTAILALKPMKGAKAEDQEEEKEEPEEYSGLHAIAEELIKHVQSGDAAGVANCLKAAWDEMEASEDAE